MGRPEGKVRIEEQPVEVAPHDLDAEKSVLGAMLENPVAADKVLGILREDDFYSGTHRIVFRAVANVAHDARPVDQRTVSDELRKAERYEKIGGRKLIYELVESVPISSNAEAYARIVRRTRLERDALDSADRLRRRILNPNGDSSAHPIEAARSELDAILRGDKTEKIGKLEGSVEDLAAKIQLRRRSREEKGVALTGVTSGLNGVDFHTGGWQKGRLDVWAGRTNMGKTLTLNQFGVYAAAEEEGNVLLFTPEMHRHDVLERAASSLAEIPYKKLQRGNITDDEYRAFYRSSQLVGKLPLIVDDSGTITLDRIRRQINIYRPRLVIVDYIQRLKPENERVGRTEQVSALANGLAAIAQDEDVPVIAGAQLSREVERRDKKNRRPTLPDLRDSGVIEEAADRVVFLYREHYYDPDAPEDEIEFLCEKDRHGDPWQALMYLVPGVMRIVDKRTW